MTSDTVLIPGWGFTGLVWDGFLTTVPQAGRVHSLDFPFIEGGDIQQVLNHLVEKIPDHSTVVGWSLGGLVAIKLASLFPEKISRLVLIAATPKFIGAPDWRGVDHVTACQFQEGIAQDKKNAWDAFCASVYFPGEDAEGLENVKKARMNHSSSLLHYLHWLFQSDFRREYQHLKIPLLHVLGGKDKIMKVNRVLLKQLNPNTDICLLNEAGHAPFLTHRAEVAEALLDFFSKKQ